MTPLHCTDICEILLTCLVLSVYQDDIASSARTELEREQEAEAQRLKLIREKRRAALQSQIFVVTATYRRTQSELNALIVEVGTDNIIWYHVFFVLTMFVLFE